MAVHAAGRPLGFFFMTIDAVLMKCPFGVYFGILGMAERTFLVRSPHMMADLAFSLSHMPLMRESYLTEITLQGHGLGSGFFLSADQTE